MKQKIFFTSDLHFGHANVIKFDNRPFEDIKIMEKELIRRWNEKVSPGDMVYMLGDIFWKTGAEPVEILKKLNGQKYLITGNHDRWQKSAPAKKLLCGIESQKSIQVELNDGSSVPVFMSHYYTPFYPSHFYGGVMLHGHSHDTKENQKEKEVTRILNSGGDNLQIYNVGCMHWNYEPVTLDEIMERAKCSIW